MASNVINTTGWSSSSHSGYTTFSPSSPSVNTNINANTTTSNTNNNNFISGNTAFSGNNAEANAHILAYHKYKAQNGNNGGDIVDYVTNNKTANNGYTMQDFMNFANNLAQLNSESKSQNIEQARENAQLQYNYNASLMRLQHELNENSAERVMEFNALESEKNRQFQERLANSAHVREIEDLKKAGLNPVLSGLGGQGAFTTGGSEAQGHNASVGLGSVSSIATDLTNNASVLSSIYNTFLNNLNERMITDTKNDFQAHVEDAYNDTLRDTTMIQSLINAGGLILSKVVNGIGQAIGFGAKKGVGNITAKIDDAKEKKLINAMREKRLAKHSFIAPSIH